MKKIILLLLIFYVAAFSDTYSKKNGQCLDTSKNNPSLGHSFQMDGGTFFSGSPPKSFYKNNYGDIYSCVVSYCRPCDGGCNAYGKCTYVGSQTSSKNCSCPSGQVMINGKCQVSCKSNQFLKDGKCVTYCKPPFQYVRHNNKNYCQFSTLNKQTCQSKGYYWFDNIAFLHNPNFIPLPTGCYSTDISSQYWQDEGRKLALALSVGEIADVGVTVDDASSFAISKFKKIFGGAKSLWDFIRDKFSSNNSNLQDFTNQDIKVTDLKMTDKGVDPIIDLTPLHNLPDNTVWAVPDDVSASSSSYDGSMPVDTFDFSSLQQTPTQLDNMPSEIPSYTDNIIGTKNILDNSKDITSYLDDATEINTPVKAKIDISDSLTKPTETKQFDLQTMRVSQDTSGTHPIVKYKQTIKYPDGSDTILDITKTDLGKNGQIYDITTKTPLSNGDTFTKTYHIQKAPDGSIQNSYQDPATLTKVNPDGSVSVVSNASPDLSISKTKPATDLIPITTKLQEIENKQDMTNQKLDDIDNNFKDFINYKPPVNDDFDQSLKNFQNGVTSFDLNISNYLDYLKNFKATLQSLKVSFDNSKKILDNKPTFTEHSGMCGFNIHAFRQSYHVDPCMFVTPYRPILVVFFTLLGNIFVFVFAVKYLVSKGDDK